MIAEKVEELILLQADIVRTSLYLQELDEEEIKELHLEKCSI